MQTYYLAIDLKINEGSFVVGSCSSERINTLPVGSFPISPVNEEGILYWDLEAIFEEIKKGIIRAQRMFGEGLVSVGITAWGNDFVLLDKDGKLIQKPRCYYDQDNRGLMDQVSSIIPSVRLYSITASNNTHLSSLYQLLAMTQKNPDILERAKMFLTIPDVFNYWLTGILAADQTNASTTQLYNPSSKTWALPLIESLSLPSDIFPTLRPAGYSLGAMKSDLANQLGLSVPLQVVIPGCHDTACALASIPDEGGNFAYLSSETWSILGSVIRRPVVSHDAMCWNFSNECGVAGGVNLLNVMLGQWALEQCRDIWAAEDGAALSWEDIADLAMIGTPFKAVVDISDPVFSVSGDMPEVLRHYCKKTGQAIPETRADCVRILMEGLALSYRRTVERLETLTGQRVFCLYVVGNGALNSAMNLLTANALNRRVVAGSYMPVSLGNLMMQMISGGCISTLSEGRKILKNSTLSVAYDPSGQEGWAEAEQFLKTLSSSK